MGQLHALAAALTCLRQVLASTHCIGQKSSFGFFVTSYGKPQMNFLVNPTFRLPGT